MKKILTFAIILLVVISVNAQETSESLVFVDGLYYFIESPSYTAIVANDQVWEDDELVIPETITWCGKDYIVGKIWCTAFDYCLSLRKVIIPKTVNAITNVGIDYDDMMNPFVGCRNLESIEVAEDNPSFCSVDGVLFSKDKTVLRCYPAGARRETYTVPDGVERIGTGAFSYNQWLKSVVVANSVNEVSNFTFSYCSSLEHVKLSENLKGIGFSDFRDCASLKSIEFPTGLLSIGGGAFNGCKSLTDITLPEGLHTVGSYAFQGCTALQSVTLPSTLETVEYWLFCDCHRLTDVTIPNGVTRLNGFAFENCTSLNVLDLPESVTYISHPFIGCMIKSLVIRGSVALENNSLQGLDTSSVIYVPANYVGMYKLLYRGTILPLEAYQPTGVDAVLHHEDASFFNLQGRRLTDNPSQSGIYIQNGRKVVIR